MKRLFGVAIMGLSSLTLMSCGGPEFVIWSYNNDIETSGDLEHFLSEYGDEYQIGEEIDVKFVQYDSQVYSQTIMSVLKTGKNAPDLIVSEFNMLSKLNASDYLADLELMMDNDPDVNKAEMKEDFTDYIWELGTYNNTLRSISWTQNPGMIYFKMDMAVEVWGNQEGFPELTSVSNVDNQAVSDWLSINKFNTLDNLLQAQHDVIKYNPNWRLFPDDSALRHYAKGSDDIKGWIADDGLISVDRLNAQVKYMDIVKEMHDEKLTAVAEEASNSWFDLIGGSLNNINGQDISVVAYTLPAWGLDYVLTDHAAEGSSWGVSSGPNSYFRGTPFMSINKNSKYQDMAYDFIKATVFDDNYLKEKVINDKEISSRNSIMNYAKDFYPDGHYLLGGMDHISTFQNESEKIDASHLTIYDIPLENLSSDATFWYMTGVLSKEEAMDFFYSTVERSFPEIYRNDLSLPRQRNKSTRMFYL